MNIFEHGLLRYFTTEQLALIQGIRIAIGGAGGLGSNICAILVRTGFKNLEVIDKDVVEASNLNRQDFTLTDIGRPKVECLKARLLNINPDLNIVTHHQEWRAPAVDNTAGKPAAPTISGSRELFNGANIVVEAFDQAEIKRAFTEYYAPRAPFVVCGNGMAGLAGLPAAGHEPTDVTAVRRVGNIFLVGDGITSIHDGHPALAPRVIQCAAKMAEVTLALTLNAS
ncbi:MAG: sulfur carrier protein ThiS adenylyltransferase ThiF [Candidatus Omnitrophica bacterium]|nr:sulfur carrier protein ThiS adenylyltransferase ThiF [Candidatus Omnitrophota bacterium]